MEDAYSFANAPPVLGGIIAALREASNQDEQGGMKKGRVAEIIWEKTSILCGANDARLWVNAFLRFFIRNYILIEDEEGNLWMDFGRAIEILVAIRRGRKLRPLDYAVGGRLRKLRIKRTEKITGERYAEVVKTPSLRYSPFAMVESAIQTLEAEDLDDESGDDETPLPMPEEQPPPPTSPPAPSPAWWPIDAPPSPAPLPIPIAIKPKADAQAEMNPIEFAVGVTKKEAEMAILVAEGRGEKVIPGGLRMFLWDFRFFVCEGGYGWSPLVTKVDRERAKIFRFCLSETENGRRCVRRLWAIEDGEVAPPGQWLKDLQDIAAGRETNDPIINSTLLKRTGTP